MINCCSTLLAVFLVVTVSAVVLINQKNLFGLGFIISYVSSRFDTSRKLLRHIV